METKNDALLLVANWESSTGYAWWLMESFWQTLGKHYLDKGKDVYLIYPSISTVPEGISESGIKVRQFDFGKSTLFSYYQLFCFVRRFKIGVIYLSDYAARDVRYIVCHIAGAKHIIVHEHTPGVRDVPGQIKLFFKKAIHRLPFYCASGLIATTEYIRNRQIQVKGIHTSKCYCAPNGLPDLPGIDPVDLHQQFSIPAERKIMVATGRANKYKGINFSLTVLAELVNYRNRNDVHFLFCGDGPDLNEFKELAVELGVNEHVTFTGHLDSVLPYLVSCDFALHSSKGEVGYSLSILEYMQCGLPVIVPDNPSVCGASEDGVNGFIYKESDLQSATDKVLEMLNNEELVLKMGMAARNCVMEKYRLSNTHEHLLKAVIAITS